MKIMKLACVALSMTASAFAFALAGEAAAGQEGAVAKKVTVACFSKDGAPVGGCDVEFWTQNYHYKHRCVTADSGICQTILQCCGPKSDPPQLMWRVKATSVHGQKDGGYFWSSCGWQCGESKYIRITFK
jgi:hypothetical protein